MSSTTRRRRRVTIQSYLKAQLKNRILLRPCVDGENKKGHVHSISFGPLFPPIRAYAIQKQFNSLSKKFSYNQRAQKNMQFCIVHCATVNTCRFMHVPQVQAVCTNANSLQFLQSALCVFDVRYFGSRFLCSSIYIHVCIHYSNQPIG